MNNAGSYRRSSSGHLPERVAASLDEPICLSFFGVLIGCRVPDNTHSQLRRLFHRPVPDCPSLPGCADEQRLPFIIDQSTAALRASQEAIDQMQCVVERLDAIWPRAWPGHER